MKKSFVISLHGVFKRIVTAAAAAGLAACLFYFEIPDKLLVKMAENIMLGDKNGDFLSSFFSLSAQNNVFLNISPKPALAAAPVLQNDKKESQPEETPSPILEKTPDDADLSNSKSSLSVSDKGVIVSNIAGKSFNISELLAKPLNYNPKTGGYKILILHSHTTEAYFPNDRSENQNQNIVRVGKEFERVFNENGIKALHITKVHDAPYSLSYKNSLESVTATLKENPSIEIVIDVHRDAIFDKNNDKLKPLCEIGGEKAAQVMIVTGTNAGGLPHDSWIENLAFSLKLQQKMNEKYKGLARPINLSKERYNTHTTKASVIFEIGANGNTIEEAVTGARYAALSVVSLLVQ